MIASEDSSCVGDVHSGDVLHITSENAPSAMSPTSNKRFIVEPQVLNAALEVVERRPSIPSPSTHSPVGGLPPPPRPNSRKERLPRSSLSSPSTSGDHSIVSPRIPNSPLSSPYSNSPDTPANSDSSPHVRPSPRLSNILRGESILFNSIRRQSLVDQDQDGKEDELPTVYPWSPRDQGEEMSSPQSSFQGSLPSSPEMSATPVDGSRPSRQNRYLTGLQKITKLGNMFSDTGVRSARRMSDAELDPRRGMKKASRGSEDLSSRYRRMLDKGVRTAGELIKPSTSVPSSPISSPVVVVKNVSLGSRDKGGGMQSGPGFNARRVRSPSATGSVVATHSAQSQVQGSPSPRVWLSHGRQTSDLSSSSASHTASFSPTSASESSHEPPSVSTEPRISISSTIYPTSSNNHSFDISRYPNNNNSMPAMSPDRESFIDLASPTFSPFAAEFSLNAKRAPVHDEQPIPPTSRQSNDSHHGKSSSRSTSPPGSKAEKPRLARLIPPSTAHDKPPIPTAPKPDFSYRSRSANSQSNKRSPLNSFASDLDASLSTFSASNALTPKERAERVRTTRKLAQLFGQPPGVSPSTQEVNGRMPIPGPLALNLKRKHHKPAASMSDDVTSTTPVYDAAGDMVWPPPEGTRYVTLASRRYSAPLSPDDFSYFVPPDSDHSHLSHSMNTRDPSAIDIGPVQRDHASDASSVKSRRRRPGAVPGSPMSFMDLSDEEGANDSVSEILVETPKASRGRHPFASTASLAESITSDQQAEEERRRKREKLAKLHRFLGSRVPPHLVLGPLNDSTPLPPPALDDPTDEEDIRKAKMRRRRSSSAAEFSRTWSDDIDRLKEELNEREKAINVRRAVKMEKMFGVAPPQTLYHTRAPVASSPNISIIRQPSPSLKIPPPRSPATPPFRFTTTGPSSKTKTKKRPGTGDSSQPLIEDVHDNGLLNTSQSSVYMHFRHSLNSLNDIIDRDDKESLAELHDYVTGDHYKTGEQYDYQFAGPHAVSSSNASGTAVSPLFDEFAVTTPTSTRSERRRSLPSRVSIASFSSEISSIIAPTPTAMAAAPSFQQRRRRAAKLTHFFGVDYRDLMSEILDSIEKGLEEERGKGTLKPDEVKDLQQKLVSLKTKRNSLSR